MSSSWREIIGRSDLSLETVIGNYFPGDSEFTRAVATCVDEVLSTGDVHKWAELKRFDSHAAKHGKTQPDQLVNLTSMLISRVCALSGSTHSKIFFSVLTDRMENFHNQCREEIPTTSAYSTNIPKHALLYPYNVKSYSSILELIGIFLLKGDISTRTELGKRIASNHNHWFHFGHLVELLKSLVASPESTELYLSLSVGIFDIISGMCGGGLFYSPAELQENLIDKSGIVSSCWIGDTLLDCLESCVPASAASCLNALSTCILCVGEANADPNQDFVTSFKQSVPARTRTILTAMNRVTEWMNTIGPLRDCHIVSEILNFFICALAQVDGEWEQVVSPQIVEGVTRVIFTRVVNAASSFDDLTERVKTLALKWLRIIMLGDSQYGPTRYVWKSLLVMDSPVFDFVNRCFQPQTTRDISAISTCITACDLVRIMFQRDIVFRLFGSAIDTVFSNRGVAFDQSCALERMMKFAFTIRQCRKSCAFVLQQSIVRDRNLVMRVLFTDGPSTITENLARMLLDPEYESDCDLFTNLRRIGGIAEIDLEPIIEDENKNIKNFSKISLIALNSLVETDFIYKLESRSEREDSLSNPNDQLNRWVVKDNIICGQKRDDTYSVVYHEISARLMALSTIYTSDNVLMARVLGLVETATGVVNNDLHKELVAVDALFLILNSAELMMDLTSNLELFYALKIVENALDNRDNRYPILQFIQYRWTNRFSVLKALIAGGDMTEGDDLGVIQAGLVSGLFKIISIEMLAANQVKDSDAEHVANMKLFGEVFIESDLSRGTFSIMDCVVGKFAANRSYIVPEADGQFPALDITEPESNLCIISSQILIELVDNFIGLIVQWTEKIAQSSATQVIQSLIESVDVSGNELFAFCYFSKLLPQFAILLAAGKQPSLAFNLRLIQTLVEQYNGTKNVAARTGIVESLCVSLHSFVGMQDAWMIDEDKETLNKIINVLFHFACKISIVKTTTFALTTLMAFLITTRDPRRKNASLAVEIVRSLIVDKYKLQFDSALNTDPIGKLLSDINEFVNNDILYRELGI